MRARIQAIPGITDKRAMMGDKHFYLPVVVDDINISTDGAQTDYTSVGAGDFSQAGSGPKPALISPLNALTLDYVPGWYSAPGRPLTHEQLRDRLQGINNARTPVSLTMTLPATDRVFFRSRVTFRNVTLTLKGAEPDTWYWALDISEWRDARSGRAVHGAQSRKPGVTLPTSIVPTASDTLHSLAHEFYGAYAGWRAIAEASSLRGWGPNTPIVQSARFAAALTVGGPKVVIPAWAPATAAQIGAATGRVITAVI